TPAVGCGASTLAEIAKRLGRKALKDVARVAKPDTLLACYRRLVAEKFDVSRHHADLAALESRPKSRRSWSGLRGKTAVGATIGSSVRWPIWAIRSQTKPWATSTGITLTRVTGYRCFHRENNDAHLFARSRTLWIRHFNGLDCSIESCDLAA